METDWAWEQWGRRDPYFGVITDPKFRRRELTNDTKREFFETGRLHVQYVFQVIRQFIDPNFSPGSVLDFGCGVGRLVVPFSEKANDVVGLDVSPSMLMETRKNCDERGISNVHLLMSDDDLSSLSNSFDLIHSCIVFQHIPPDRGRTIFQNLLCHLNPGGVGAVHFSYSKSHYAPTYGLAPASSARPATRSLNPVAPIELPDGVDPEMQMNPYQLTELYFFLQVAGVRRVHSEFTDHGGELGVFLYFQKPQ